MKAQFIDIHEAADMIGVGSVEVSEYLSQIRDACKYGDIEVKEVPATGHPTRYFEVENEKITEKSAPLRGLVCEFDSLENAALAVVEVWKLYLEEIRQLAANNSGSPIECHWLSDPFPRIFANPDSKAKYLVVKFFALIAHAPASPAERPETALHLPWAYQEDSDKYTHIIRGPNKEFLCSGPQDSSGKTEAIMRFIVTACNNYDALRRSHAALVALLDSRLEKMNCVCKLIGFIGKEPPCDTCKDRAALAAAKKLETL